MIQRPHPQTIETPESTTRGSGHPGYGRFYASTYRQTEAQAWREAFAFVKSGYPTLSDYRTARMYEAISRDLGEEETTSLLDFAEELEAETKEEPVTVTLQETPAGDPPRNEAPLPSPSLASRFWEAVDQIVQGSEYFWTWIDRSFPIVEYGSCVELSVPSPMIKEHSIERSWEQSVFGAALSAIGIEKPCVLAIRPKPAQTKKEAPPKKKDPILADLEEEMAAQRALDPRRTNEGVKSQLAILTSLWFLRLRELRGARKGQNHIVEWRKAAQKKGVSAFESTGELTGEDIREAKRALRKDSS